MIDFKKNKTHQKKIKASRLARYIPLALIMAMVFVPEVYAKTTGSTGEVKVFTEVTDKILGWVTGGFGKLIVAISVILSVIMGVAGFKWQQILIPLILGLLLGSINGIVGLFF